MENSNIHNQPGQLPPLDLGTPWMPDVMTAKMHHIHEKISPKTSSNLSRRNALRWPAESVTIVDREEEPCMLKRTNAVRRKRTNTETTDLSADTVTGTEASVNEVQTNESSQRKECANVCSHPQPVRSLRPSRFTEHLLEDDVDLRGEAKPSAGVSKAVCKMKAGLKGMLRHV